MIKWGIIGCGKIAAKFAADLALVSGGELHAVASRSLARAQSFADEHGAVLFFDSYAALVECAEIDAIYVATPHTFHQEHTLFSLHAGKHVLCEKPMGINHGQVVSMLEAAVASDRLLMEALWTHFLPAVIAAKAAITAGDIGEVSHMRSDFGFAANPDPSLRLLNPYLGGGALLDIGIYPAYIMLEVLGEPSEIAVQTTLGDTGVDLHTAVMAKYDSGQHAYLEASLRVETSCTTTVYGDKGHIVINSRWHETDSYTIVRGADVKTVTLPKTGFGYYHEIVAFNQSLRGRSMQPPFPHSNSERLIRFLDLVRGEIGLRYPDEN